MKIRIDTAPAPLYDPKTAARMVAELNASGEDARIVEVGNDRGLVRIDLYEDGDFVMSWKGC
jgi:hypothetical protein